MHNLYGCDQVKLVNSHKYPIENVIVVKSVANHFVALEVLS